MPNLSTTETATVVKSPTIYKTRPDAIQAHIKKFNETQDTLLVTADRHFLKGKLNDSYSCFVRLADKLKDPLVKAYFYLDAMDTLRYLLQNPQIVVSDEELAQQFEATNAQLTNHVIPIINGTTAISEDNQSLKASVIEKYQEIQKEFNELALPYFRQKQGLLMALQMQAGSNDNRLNSLRISLTHAVGICESIVAAQQDNIEQVNLAAAPFHSTDVIKVGTEILNEEDLADRLNSIFNIGNPNQLLLSPNPGFVTHAALGLTVELYQAATAQARDKIHLLQLRYSVLLCFEDNLFDPLQAAEKTISYIEQFALLPKESSDFIANTAEGSELQELQLDIAESFLKACCNLLKKDAIYESKFTTALASYQAIYSSASETLQTKHQNEFNQFQAVQNDIQKRAEAAKAKQLRLEAKEKAKTARKRPLETTSSTSITTQSSLFHSPVSTTSPAKALRTEPSAELAPENFLQDPVRNLYQTMCSALLQLAVKNVNPEQYANFIQQITLIITACRIYNSEQAQMLESQLQAMQQHREQARASFR